MKTKSHMKNLLFFTLFLLGMICPMQSSAAISNPTVTFPMGASSGNGDNPGNGGEDDDDKNKKNKRIPAARVQCTIDFENLTVTGAFSSDLLTFEVWNEEGVECLATFTDEASFVSFLSEATSEVYCLRFYSATYIYTGFISFE